MINFAIQRFCTVALATTLLSIAGLPCATGLANENHGERTDRSWCEDYKCLESRGCVELYEFSDGDMSPPISDELCNAYLRQESGDKEGEENIPKCWKTKNGKPFGSSSNESDEIFLTEVSAHMGDGFEMGNWKVKGDDQDKIVIQKCLVPVKRNRGIQEEEEEGESAKNVADVRHTKEFDCYVSMRPGASLSKTAPFLEGPLVATWKQGVVVGNKELSTSAANLEVSLVVEQWWKVGKITEKGSDRSTQHRFSLHETSKYFSSDAGKNKKYTPVWGNVVHHFELNSTRFSETLRLEAKKVGPERLLLEKFKYLTLELSNEDSSITATCLDDVKLMVCPEAYWASRRSRGPGAPHHPTNVFRKRAAERGEIECPGYNDGITCLCHKTKKGGGFRKICLVDSSLESHLAHGDFYPGTTKNGTRFSCSCEPEEDLVPSQELIAEPEPADALSDTPNPLEEVFLKELGKENKESILGEKANSSSIRVEGLSGGSSNETKNQTTTANEKEEKMAIEPKVNAVSNKSGGVKQKEEKTGIDPNYGEQHDVMSNLSLSLPLTQKDRKREPCFRNSLLWTCRDFSRTFPDMGSGGGGGGSAGLEQGIPGIDLNLTSRKPIWNEENEAGRTLERGRLLSTVTIKKNFDLWFRDSPSVIQKKSVRLLGNVDSGDDDDVQFYGGSNFFPFDRMVDASSNNDNTDGKHNYYFTCEHHSEFVYTHGLGAYVSYASANDGWLYVNDRLVLDLGGIHEAINKTVRLDGLNLADGSTCKLDIYFANRLPPSSSLALTTRGVCPTCTGKYDKCGVCISKETDPSYSCEDNKRLDEATESEETDRQLGEGKDVNDVASSVIVLEKQLQQNVKCELVAKGRGKYEFSFLSDLEYPHSQPSALVVGLSGYNGNIRKRGSCDNRVNDDYTPWSDANRLWDPALVGRVLTTYPEEGLNLPEWRVESKLSAGSGGKTFRSIKYFVEMTAERLSSCKDHQGLSPIITDESGTGGVGVRSYAGHWTITRSSPVDLNDESKGETKLHSVSCSFRLEEWLNGSATVTVESSGPMLRSESRPERASSYFSSLTSGSTGNSDATTNNLLPAVRVISTWVSSSCTENRSAAFVMKTCSYSSGSSDEHWVTLNYPTVSFENGGPDDGIAQSEATVVALKSVDEEECNPRNVDTWLCCQTWLIMRPLKNVQPNRINASITNITDGGSNTIDFVVPEGGDSLEGVFEVQWRAFVFEIARQTRGANGAAASESRFVAETFVLAKLSVNVTDVCQREPMKLSAENTVSGELTIHLDPDMTKVYLPSAKTATRENDYKKRVGTPSSASSSATVSTSEPLRHSSPIYVKLVPNLSKEECSSYDIVVKQVVMHHNGQSGKSSITVIYDKETSDANSIYKPSVTNNPRGACFSNVSWILTKPNCTDGKLERLTSGDSESRDSEREEIARYWDGSSGRWADGDPYAAREAEEGTNKRAREATDVSYANGEMCKMNVTIFWEIVPKGGRSDLVSKRAESKVLLDAGGPLFRSDSDRDKLIGKARDRHGKINSRAKVAKKRFEEWRGMEDGPYQGFLRGSGANIEIICNEGGRWNAGMGRCVPGDWRHNWFGEECCEDDAFFWAMFGLFWVFIGLFLLLCCVATYDYYGEPYYHRKKHHHHHHHRSRDEEDHERYRKEQLRKYQRDRDVPSSYSSSSFISQRKPQHERNNEGEDRLNVGAEASADQYYGEEESDKRQDTNAQTSAQGAGASWWSRLKSFWNRRSGSAGDAPTEIGGRERSSASLPNPLLEPAPSPGGNRSTGGGGVAFNSVPLLSAQEFDFTGNFVDFFQTGGDRTKEHYQ
jgi:fibro-slime domain-containing protein